MFSQGGKAPPDPPKEKGPWAPDFSGGPGLQKLFLGAWAPLGSQGGLKGRWASRTRAQGPPLGPWGASRPMGPMKLPPEAICYHFLVFLIGFFSLFNRSRGPGTIKIEFSIKKYPRGLIYSFRS